MRTRYELKEAARLGPGEEDDKEARVLNRIVRWTSEGLEYEADPRQGEKIVEELAFRTAKEWRRQQSAIPLTRSRKTRKTHYRAFAAMSNYLSADRPDCQFSSREVCRFMAEPTTMGVEALERIGRYLVKRPRLVYKYPVNSIVSAFDIYVDTDHAGCLRTRKSTSGGCVLAGRHLLKSWSSIQPTITPSSGEAELHGVVRGGAVGLSFMSLLSDLGVHLPLRVWTDSTASQGILRTSRSWKGQTP